MGSTNSTNASNRPFLQNITKCTGEMNIRINIWRMDKYEEIRLLAEFLYLKKEKIMRVWKELFDAEL